jgi:hypothetical protein
MQNTITIRNKRSAAPIFGILAATTAILTVVPLLFSSPDTLVPQQKSERIARAVAEPIYQELGHADELLQAGHFDAAAALLDAQRNEPLIVCAGGYGQGTMVADSPTTLLMRLVRTIKLVAYQELKQGHTQEALLWVVRIHGLTAQALKTPCPSYESLLIAYYMETSADRTEAGIWVRMGNLKRAARVNTQYRKVLALWTQEILPQISTTGHSGGDISPTRRSWVGYQKFTAYKETDTQAFNGEETEEGHSRQLLKVLKTTLQLW